MLGVLGGKADQVTEAEIVFRLAPSFLAAIPATQVVRSTQQFAADSGPITYHGYIRPLPETHAVGLITTRTGDDLASCPSPSCRHLREAAN